MTKTAEREKSKTKEAFFSGAARGFTKMKLDETMLLLKNVANNGKEFSAFLEDGQAFLAENAEPGYYNKNGFRIADCTLADIPERPAPGKDTVTFDFSVNTMENMLLLLKNKYRPNSYLENVIAYYPKKKRVVTTNSVILLNEKAEEAQGRMLPDTDYILFYKNSLKFIVHTAKKLKINTVKITVEIENAEYKRFFTNIGDILFTAIFSHENYPNIDGVLTDARERYDEKNRIEINIDALTAELKRFEVETEGARMKKMSPLITNEGIKYDTNDMKTQLFKTSIFKNFYSPVDKRFFDIIVKHCKKAKKNIIFFERKKDCSVLQPPYIFKTDDFEYLLMPVRA